MLCPTSLDMWTSREVIGLITLQWYTFVVTANRVLPGLYSISVTGLSLQSEGFRIHSHVISKQRWNQVKLKKFEDKLSVGERVGLRLSL